MRAATVVSVRAIAQGLLLVFLSLLWLAIPSAAQETKKPKRVLLLFSYDSTVPSQVIAERALRATLKNDSPIPVEVFSEYQDSDRTPLENYEKELVGLLRRKYEGQKFDLIFAVSRPALSVLLKNRTELFSDTPIVFQALDQRQIADLTLGANVTGIWGEANFSRNLDLALQLHPETKKVVVVAGVNLVDKYWTAKLQEEFRPYEDRLEFAYQLGLTVSEQQRALSSLSPSTIVFYLVSTRDNAGNDYSGVDFLRQISASSSAPIYGTTDAQLGLGIVGGRLISYEAMSVQAGKLGLRVLAGENAEGIAPHGIASVMMFDWRELQHWGISEQNLPPGSIVRFKEPSLWQRYKWHVLAVLALTIAQALMIVILLIQRSRKARAENALRERLEFEKVLSELSASFVNLPLEELDETINHHLREVVKIAQVEGCSLIEFSRNHEEAFVTHRYDSTGIVESFSVIKFEQFPWYMKELQSGAIVKLRDMIADLPEEAVAERQAAHEYGIKSLLSVPIAISDTVTSALSAFTTNSYREWPAGLEMRLRLAGEIFIQAVHRKRTEELLRESEARFRIMADTAPVMVWMSGVDKLCTFFNRSWLEFTGRSMEQELGDGWAQGVETLDYEDCLNTYVTAFDERKSFRMEYRLRRWDGEYRWISDEGIPRYRPDGEFAGYIGACVDITERRNAEEALRNALTEVGQLKDQLHQENIYLRDEIRLEHNFHEIVGESDEIKYALYKIEQVAPTDSTVLILGETGTGKELVARAIHSSGSRKNRSLVKINCATLPASLVESELFGHERGAFTGAQSKKLGRFEVADGATLFLDEIGELPMELQPKLLRVLQDGEFERLGGSRTIKVDVRVIAATNRDLKREIEQGRFREDLFYRLNVYPITVPPLRDRPEDIPLLITFFVNKFNRKLGTAIDNVPPPAMSALQNYRWPGNVRELANVIERAVINTYGTTLRLADSLDGYQPVKPPPASSTSLVEIERTHIMKILETTNWKIEGQAGAANVLGLNASTLRTRLNKLGIRRPHN